MDEAAAGKAMSDAPHAAERAAVVAARERLGADLERLDGEVRSQVAGGVQKVVWKVGAAGLGFGAALVARKGLEAAWKGATKDDPPEDPGDSTTSWGAALLWTIATAVGIGLAQLVASRGADAGWRKVAGGPPPGRQA